MKDLTEHLFIAEDSENYLPAEKIRPEYNIAKFSNFLFISPKSAKVDETRRKDFIRDYKGEEVPAFVEIRPSKDFRTFTTTEQKVLYGLFQLWEQQGKPPDGRIRFSSRSMAKILGIQWNGRFANQLGTSIKVLGATTLTWGMSYENAQGEIQKFEDMYHVLDRTKYVERKIRINKDKFETMHEVKLNEIMTENLLQGKTKPFLFRQMLSIKDDSAVVLYTALDIFLSKRSSSVRELTATHIIKELLYLKGRRYKGKSIRKQMLARLVTALQDKEISAGATLKLKIKETADKSDWKLVARAVYNPIKVRQGRAKTFLKPVNDKEYATVIVEEIRQATGVVGEDDPLYKMAVYYPYQLIYEAMSIYKADYRDMGKVKNPIALFQGILHGLAHEAQMAWIFGCDKDCKHRPENRSQKSLQFLD